MRKWIWTAVVLLAAGVACGGEADVQLDDETAEAVNEIESEISRVGEEIDTSEFQEDLRSAWEEIEGELTATVESIRSGEAVDTEEIEQQLDEFQQTMETLDVEDSLDEAWTELRANLDQLMANMG